MEMFADDALVIRWQGLIGLSCVKQVNPFKTTETGTVGHFARNDSSPSPLGPHDKFLHGTSKDIEGPDAINSMRIWS